MGLFDSYYDPVTYQGAQGGLIDRLLSQFGTQVQYQPGAGFLGAQPAPGGAPMQANAQMQNDPIAVGNYMMPRIGDGFPEDTAPAVAPQMKQPMQASMLQSGTSGQPQQQALPPQQPMQSAQAIPPSAQPPWLQQPQSGLNRLGESLHSVAHGGSLYGAVTGNYDDPQAQQQRNLRLQYEALRPVLGDQKALLATINPEYGKVLVSQAFGPRHVQPLGEGYVADDQGNVRQAYVPGDKNKLVKIGQDGLGREQYGVFNPADGSIAPYKAPGSSDSSSGGLGNMDLTGKDYLASIPVAQRGTVQGMVEGTIAPPSSFALSKPYWQNMIAAAKNYDPSFDSAAWGGRVAGVKDFSAGKSSEMVRSANQTVGHVGDLIDKMDALQNGQYPMKNAVGNYLSSNVAGNPGVVGFKQNAHAVADELSKVFKGAGVSDHEIKQWEESLSENMSPAQQRESISTMLGLLRHSLSALEEKRLNSIGPMAAEKAGPLLKGDAQATLARVEKWLAGDGGGANDTPAAPAAPAQTKTNVKWSVE